MQIEGTRAAFAAMISERGVYKKLGVDVSTVSNWKIYLREEKSISLDKMEEMLVKAGATVIQEKVWNIGESTIMSEVKVDFNESEVRALIGSLNVRTETYSSNQLNQKIVDEACRRHPGLFAVSVKTTGEPYCVTVVLRDSPPKFPILKEDVNKYDY